MRVLLIEDDRDLDEVLSFALRRAGFTPLVAYDSPTALSLLRRDPPDLVVLDINLGPWNGFDLLEELRTFSAVPVIILTGRSAEDDKVRGLELGADDYVTKPFSHRELIARVKANLRRPSVERMLAQTEAPVMQVGSLVVNPGQHSVLKDGRPVKLTVTEFRLLYYLMVNAGSVVPMASILHHIWGYDDPSAPDVVRVTVHRLRRKLEDDPHQPQLLVTVPGVGFMLTAGS